MGEVLLHTVTGYAGYETVFYCTHRWLHHPSLFAYHAMHHASKASVGVSGMYQGSVDYFLTTTLAHSLAPLLCNTHVSVLWITAFLGGINSVQSHGGYVWTWDVLPSPADHALHHVNYKCNFATGPLDRLFGTYCPAANTKRTLPRDGISLS